MTERSTRPVMQHSLPNGLTVLLREDHDAPLASFWTWYRVGSRNEVPGLTGVSHWVEHMQFKGTPSLAKGQIFRDVSKHGGTLNALTSNDWTAYFETLPAERLDLALAIESDRMSNSLFDPEETESERTVILSERQGAENQPTYLLYEEVVGSSFRSHPYRHMVIGHENDLKAISRDDLYHHYRAHYLPNNAFITAVGDFDADILLTKIDKAFGQIERGPEPRTVVIEEPAQQGERRLTLRRPAPTSYLRIAYHVPSARHPDTAALLVADAVLSGGKGMGLGGGGQMGRSSRLYRSLVNAGLARAAGSDFDLFLDPYVLVIGVTALPTVPPERVEAVIDMELARLRDEPVAEDELTRALKQVKAQYVYSAEGVTNQAFWLGQMEVVDTYTRADSLVDELERVTPDDIQCVAQTYLTDDTRTIGWLLPTGDGNGTDDPDGGESGAAYHHWGWRGESRPNVAQIRQSATPPASGTSRAAFERFELPNGIVVLGQARPHDPTVVVRLQVEAGAVNDPADQAGLAAFAARAMIRGTERWSFEQINEATDALGATVSTDGGRLFAEVSVRCLREDFPTLMDLAADILRRPTYPDDEVERVRQQVLAGIREQENDTRASADRVLRELIFPAPHPLGRRLSGDATSVTALTRDDLFAFHAAHYGPKVMKVAIVGGVPSIAEAVDLITTYFGDWDSAASSPPAVPPAPVPVGPDRTAVSIAGKSQADVAIGFPTVQRTNPEYYALDTANLILGRLGLMGRLGASVRDEQGLAYYAFSQVESGREGSLWVSRAGVDPANVERAVDSILSEVRRLRDEPVSDEELDDAKSCLSGILPLALETNDGVAATLLSIEHFNLGLDYLDRYPGIIDALTSNELLTAAKTHLDPDRMAVGVAGPPASH